MRGTLDICMCAPLPRLRAACKPCDTGSMAFGAQLGEILKPAVDLVYPPRCPLCGTAIVDQGNLCPACWSELEFPGQPEYTRCSVPLPSPGHGAMICGACQADPPRHAGVVAATLYTDASRKLVLAFKHGGKIALAKLLGRMIAARLPHPDRGDGDPPLIVPVPLHRWRLWRRGYNQAALLAYELGRAGKGRVLVDGLIRRKRTVSLGGLGREAREAVLAGAISAHPARAATLSGRDVILVDDVLTSGATSAACVAALHDVGVSSVLIACFARVPAGLATAQRRAPSENETPEAIKTSGAA